MDGGVGRFQVELEEIEEIDGENVLVHVTQSGLGREAGSRCPSG